ncbi:MAG TPA: hypothetical protein VMY37_33680 [Thermoguttaceae bacterium]|nr:hypothetical protein [Thermoguttaceae bacterium]
MDQIRRQVRKAQRQLGFGRFIGVLGWCCFGTSLAALAMIVLYTFFLPLGWEKAVGSASTLGLMILGLAVAVGGLVAWLLAVIRGQGSMDAAIEIDRRYGLKERVSSALALSEEDRQSGPGQALVDDAERRVRRIDVREHFSVSPGRQILLPVIPAVIAVLIAVLVQPVGPKQAQATTDPAIKKQIEKSTDGLRRKLVEKRKEAEKQGLKDAQELFKRLEEAADDLADRTKGDRKQALVKLNDLARQIKERRKDLGGAEQVRKQLNEMKGIEQGPADEFVKAIKDGDLKKAVNELEQLKSKLAEGKLNEQEREQLAKQLEQVKDKLQNLAEAHRQAQQDLEKRINQAQQEGRNDEAAELQEQLDKLQQQQPQMEQLDNLANKLGQCAQCMKNGQLNEAGEMLDQLQSDVGDLQEQLQEMEMLEDAMSQLGQCRDQMNCPQCNGMGCGACMGDKPGLGLGRGRGKGDRPEAEDDVDFIDTRPPMKIGPGAASLVGEVEGPNIRGNVQQELTQQFEAARAQTADPVTVQHLPRGYQDHALEYLDRLREGDR